MIQKTKKLKNNKIIKQHGQSFKSSHWMLTSMFIPAVVLLFIFSYIPMFGIVVAFKDLKFSKGIWGSAWNGIENFIFLFKSDTLWILLRNTVLYKIVGMILGNAIPVIIALCLERVTKKFAIKFYQSGMFLPYFLSWVVVSYFSAALFDYDAGMINSILNYFGATKIDFYREPVYWPFILIAFSVWKGLGYSTLIFYGSLLSIDPALYEAAVIDGCTEWKKIWYISVPHLIQPIIIVLLLGLGGIFHSDFGLYYFIPNDTGALLKVTDVLDTYIFRTLRNATNVGISSAIAFLQSVVGLIFVILGNTLARMYDEECALF
ncbi:MAG: ABC transporter permease subunit [Clostridia bacterium]|nr:ABC transporter permease subunit [Clostridia bacterium]